MSRHIHPNINASLLRELRMLAQEFFYTKRSMSRDTSIFGKPTPAPALKCVFCLQFGSATRAKNAVAVRDGNSVCELHANYKP